ncbi:MAG: hypothetical protein INQ03_08325 [Candidatus Heimdallarchaeota archaeon]|nr:hypothetical protein [Candidatus Heimdallarchaeota archaeon]
MEADKIEKIIKLVENSTSTAEYKVREEFEKHKFSTRTLYYTDNDDGVKKIRELDLLATRIVKSRELGGNLLNHMNSFWLAFLGDVKFPIKYEPKTIIGLEWADKDVEKLQWDFMNHRIAFNYWFYSLNYEYKSIWYRDFNKLPLCKDLLVFDEKGQGKKNEYLEKVLKACNQIISAYQARIEKIHDEMINNNDEVDKLKEIIIPIVVLGNDVVFLSGYHKKIIEEREVTESYFIIYFHQLRTPDLHEVIPIVITSLNKLNRVIPKLEDLVKGLFNMIH